MVGISARLALFARLFLIALLCFSTFGCSTLEKSEEARNAAANIYEGDRQLNLGHVDQARGWFDKAIAIDPHALNTYVGFDDIIGGVQGGLIESLSNHSNWPLMVQYLTKAVSKPPLSADWQLWANLGQAYDMLDQEPQAQSAYKTELGLLTGAQLQKGATPASIDPDQYLLQKAIAEWGMGDHAAAMMDYRRIISRYPQDAPEAQNGLAYSEAVANINLPEAYSLATAAVAAVRAAGDDSNDETLGEFLDTLGWVEYRMGKYNDAARDMEDALSDIPREPVSHYHLAMIYQAMDDNADAVIEIERAAAMDPSNPTTMDALRRIAPASPQSSKT